MQDVQGQFLRAGLDVDWPPEIGKLVRCKADGDRGQKKSGWYVLHELRLDSGETVLVGRFGNWKGGSGDEGLAVQFDTGGVSETEIERMRRAAAEARLKAAEEKQKRAEDAARRARTIWPKLPDSGASPYLSAKAVRAWGVRFSRGSIVVPVRNGDGDLVGLQFIGPEGDKKFLTGTPKRACFHLIGEITSGAPLAIAEGYATAATVHEATGWPCVVAFDAGNLKPVARVLRALHPDLPFVFCADNDARTDGNPGVTKAAEAAAFVGNARVAVPDFQGAAA